MLRKKNGIAENTTWLIVAVFFLAQNVMKTGISNRIAYIFVRLFGKNIIGLTYSFVIADFMITPFIPTAAAKSGSIAVPVINSVTDIAK